MTIKIPLFSLLVLCTTACTMTSLDVTDYIPPDPMRPDCVGSRGNRVQIKVSGNDFGVAPANLCVRRGDVVTFRIVGNPKNATVALDAKPLTPAAWLKGSANGQGSFRVTVQAPEAGRVYYYTIEAPGLGTIDPMISVEN